MKEKLRNLIDDTLNKLNYSGVDIIIDKTKDNKFGDYSCNVAMLLGRILKTNPYDIALNLVNNLEKSQEVDKIEVVKPGFINFFVNNNYLIENLKNVLIEKDDYGKSKIGNNERILIEFVSANPTGYLHVGHVRGAAYGDALSRIKKFNSYDVIKEYYINDAGVQIDKLGISLKSRYLELFNINLEIPDGGYMGKEIILLAHELKEIYNDTLLNEENDFFKNYGLKKLLGQIETDLQNFGVVFDKWTSEQSLYDEGKVINTLEKLKESGYTYNEEGALFLKTSEYGDDKDRVIIKNDGTYTYLLPDIALHLNKYNYNVNRIIDVLGADHHGYISRIKASMEIMGQDSSILDIKIGQMVRMVKDGVEVKMSKRTGNAYTLKDLLKEVGKDATRYFFIAKSLDCQMDFDLDLATKESNDNPVYYIQYATARISSILREYNYENIEDINEEYLNNEHTINLMNKIYSFKEVVINASNKEMPHLITNYTYDLANAFHVYYAHEKVLVDNEEEKNTKINLLKATLITIKNALNLIGVDIKERM